MMMTTQKISIIGNHDQIIACQKFYQKYGFEIASCACETGDEAISLKSELGIIVHSFEDWFKQNAFEQHPVIFASTNLEFQEKVVNKLLARNVPEKQIILHPAFYSPELESLIDSLSNTDNSKPNEFIQYLLENYPDSGAYPIRILADLISDKIKKDIDSHKKTIAVYYPDSAYRFHLGSAETYKKIRQRGYNVIFLFGEKCNDEFEQREFSYYVGQGYQTKGILTYLDFIDLFVLPSVMTGLPEKAKKILFVHDIFDSPVGPEWYPIRYSDDRVMCESPYLDELDYIFMPSTVVSLVTEKLRPPRKKPLVIIPGGYIKLDQNINYFKKYDKPADSIIYAPTVTKGEISEYVSLPKYGEQIIEALLNTFPDYNIIFRPHPHTLHLKCVADIKNRFSKEKRFIFDSNRGFYMDNYSRSALMVSDLSGTAFTYAFTTLRPVIFFSHNEKENLEEVFQDVKYFRYRHDIGFVVTNIEELKEKAAHALNNAPSMSDKIAEFRQSIMYNIGKVEDYFVDNIDLIVNGKKKKDWKQIAYPLYSSILENPLDTSLPKMIEAGYKGYNIVYYKDRYYALSISLGAFDLTTTTEKTMKGYLEEGMCVVSQSFEDIKHQIDKANIFPTPQLIEENYKGYNIGAYRRKFYALAIALGPIDLTNLPDDQLKIFQNNMKCAVADSLEEVRQIVDGYMQTKRKQIQPSVSNGSENNIKKAISDAVRTTPVLIEMGYKEYNILLYNKKYYGIYQSLAFKDISDASEEKLQNYQKSGTCYIANSIEEIKQLIDRRQINNTAATPDFVIETYKGFNLFIHKNRCYALNQTINPLEITKSEGDDSMKLQNSGQCFTGKSFADVKSLIDQRKD
jgi:hypothetical protein